MIKTTIINRLFRSAEQNIYHRETWNRHRLTKMDITLYYLRKSTCFSDLLKVSSRIIFLMESCDDVVDAAIAKRFSVDENLDLGIISLHWSLLQWRLCVGENDIWRVLLKKKINIFYFHQRMHDDDIMHGCHRNDASQPPHLLPTMDVGKDHSPIHQYLHHSRHHDRPRCRRDGCQEIQPQVGQQSLAGIVCGGFKYFIIKWWYCYVTIFPGLCLFIYFY